MATRNTTVRLSTEGSDQFKRDLREAGATGETALEKIEKASKPASKGLKLVGSSSQEARRGIDGMASNAGGLSRVLTSIGPLGLAAGAAFGVLAVGMNRAGDAIPRLDEIGKTADSLGVAIGDLQRFRFALGSVAGIAEGQTDAALKAFTTRIGQAAQGVGEAKAVLEQFKIELRDSQGEVRSTESLIQDIAGTLQGMKSEQEQAAFAARFFGEEAGPKMALALRDGGAAIEEASKRAAVFSDEMVRQSEIANDRIETASQKTATALDRISIRLGPMLVRSKELQASITGGAEDVLRVVGDGFARPDELSQAGLVTRYEDTYGVFLEEARELKELEAEYSSANVVNARVAETILDSQRKKVEALRAEYQVFADELKARREPVDASSASSAGDGDGILPPTPPDPAVLALARAKEDASLARKRSLEDERIIRLSIQKIQTDGLETSQEYLRNERERLKIERAGADAALAAKRAGKDVDFARRNALGQAIDVRLLGNAERDLAGARKTELARLAAKKKSDAELLKAQQEFTAALADERKKTNEMEREIAADSLALDKEQIADKIAALDRIRDLSRDREFSRERAAPVIEAASGLDGITTASQLEALEAQLQVQRDLVAVRQAGAEAVADAAKYENPETLRAIAEGVERNVIAERQALEAFREKRTEIREAERERADALRESEATYKAAEAARKRAKDTAARESEREIAAITGVTTGLIQQSREWNSLRDVILSAVDALQQMGAFDALLSGAFGSSDGTEKGLNGLFAGIGSAIGGLFGGGSAFGRGLPAIEIGTFEGGGFTGAGTRSGGVDGRGGFMALLHPNETVIDHTRGQGVAPSMPDVNFRIITSDRNTRVERDNGIRPGSAAQSRNVKSALGAGGAYR